MWKVMKISVKKMKILNRVEKEKKEQKRTKNNFFDLNNLYIVIINIILIYPFFFINSQFE